MARMLEPQKEPQQKRADPPDRTLRLPQRGEKGEQWGVKRRIAGRAERGR